MELTTQLRQEYETLFASCQMLEARRDEALAIANRIYRNRVRYHSVSKATVVPWFVIGVIHNMESGGDWTTNLANGDSLQERTRHEPKGRPVKGAPPFTWEFAAADALAFDGLTSWHDWSIAGCLYKLEGYNGFGSRKHGIHSPYLWAGTQHYSKGKYTADGVFNANAVSRQIGAAALLHILEYEKIISFK